MAQPPVSWSWLDGLAVLVGAFVIYILGSVVLAIIDYPFDKKNPGFWLLPASYLFLTLGTFVMARWWLIGKRHATWASIGFRIPRGRSVVRGVAWMIGLAVVAYIVTAIGSAIIVGLFELTSFHLKSNVKELLPSGQNTVTGAQFTTLLILSAVLAPITEETLFRGAVYQGMAGSARRLGRPAAIGLAALVAGSIFGVFHLIGGTGEIYTLPLLAFLGVVLCLTFQFSGSLGGSMLLHATVNFISIVAVYGGNIR